MQLQIRNISPDDVNEIITVHKKSVYGLCKEFYSQEQMRIWTDLFKHKFSNEGIKDANNVGIVAIDNNKIIGYGFINLNDKEVNGIYLIPEFTNKGIGKMILSKLESIAQDHKLNELTLNSTLNAVHFYRECGYKKIREELFQLTDNCRIPCINMIKKFY